MPVSHVIKNPEALTLAITADTSVPVTRLWEAFTDPRQIERFWGPPSFPATFDAWDLRIGGRALYYMTGPEGPTPPCFWEFLAIDEPRTLEIRQGFALDDGTPDPAVPDMRVVFVFEETTSGSRLTITSYFDDVEGYEHFVAMQMSEGMEQALSQLEAVLSA